MIDKDAVVRAVEKELAASGSVSPQACRDFDQLPIDAQAGLARAFAFIGCASAKVPAAAEGAEVSPGDRVRAVRLMLLKMALHTGAPRYSSWVLQNMAKSAIETPGGSVSDVFRAVSEVLHDYKVELTRPLATLLEDLTIHCFTKYRASYDAADFDWMAERINSGVTPAQAYVALHAIPAALVSATRQGILDALAPTEFGTQAAEILEEDGSA